MKKGLLGFGLLVPVSLVYLIIFAGSGKITNYPSAGTEIVAFGDSLVFGVGATAGNDFVSVLSGLISAPIVNLGKSGDTTGEALGRLDSVLEKKPKVVLVLLGGNDYLQKVPVAETFANLETIIKAIQQTGSIVVLLGVKGGILNDNYEDSFASLAKEYGTAYIPNVLDGIFAHPDLLSDNIHPNNAGYKIMAERIYPIVSPLLE